MDLDAAHTIFESMTTIRRIDDLINDGEAEGLHIECKSPVKPRLTRDQKANLARAVSGFSNTSGGIILWGVSTTNHAHSNLDVLTQIEPIGSVTMFERQIVQTIPTLTNPPILSSTSRSLKRRKKDTRGVVLTYIPKSNGDPVQSTLDDRFYYRAGDDFVVAPYDMIKRLFASTESPDLHALVDENLAECDEDGVWSIPIVIENRSSAVATNTKVSLTIGNYDSCELLECTGFRDASSVNPDSKLFWNNSDSMDDAQHRGIHYILSNLRVKMKTGRRAKRRLDISISLYANKMRAREIDIKLTLKKGGLAMSVGDVTPLY